ncbi:hypothetical protein DL764_003842 [Monosporascus ibericus]|uniref:RTA1 domain protein n=1 Tax=Monosporascus ibericus TaxID=155417 RepID=A0A4Q4TIH4_9PEZI|nr:hypothetical protein DL764_003842 [Monosporascus ibericus]
MSGGPPFGPIVNGTQVVVFYEYRPNKHAGYAFMALFALATVAHLLYLIPLRAWSFVPFILGGIGKSIWSLKHPSGLTIRVAEVFGYYGRALSSDTPDKVGPWIQQNLLLLVAPPLLAATVYMCLARIVIAIGARHNLLISPRLLTPLCVLIDLGCLATQLIGAVLPASGDPHAIELSKLIILGGLIAQIAALSTFLLIAWHAQRRISRDPPRILTMDRSVNWKNHFRAIYLIIVLILIRSFVRTLEYLQGEGGFIISHEAFIYTLDATPMWLVMMIYVVLHPGRLIRHGQRLSGEEGEVMLRHYK